MKPKTVVIHQPDFAPYLGFFQRFLQADLYLVLDHVQFVTGTSRSWMHRDKIKTPQGEHWLTLSVKRAARGTPINQIELAVGTDWARDNLNLLAQNYRNAPHYRAIMPRVEALYASAPPLMADFNLRSIDMLAEMLDTPIPKVLSSTLDPQGSSNELLVDLLQKVGATHYLSGTGARAYMQPEIFEAAGIAVLWQKFEHPVYAQQFEGFIPYLSALDVLFNCGIEESRRILRSTT
jgi:hypothetical protein